MLCGVDLPRVDLIIITRPFAHLSSIIQAGGRGGKLQRDETRRRVVVYLLYNSTDVRPNAKHLSGEVRQLYLRDTCVKSILHKKFSSEAERLNSDNSWCCSFHFK